MVSGIRRKLTGPDGMKQDRGVERCHDCLPSLVLGTALSPREGRTERGPPQSCYTLARHCPQACLNPGPPGSAPRSPRRRRTRSAACRRGSPLPGTRQRQSRLASAQATTGSSMAPATRTTAESRHRRPRRRDGPVDERISDLGVPAGGRDRQRQPCRVDDRQLGLPLTSLRVLPRSASPVQCLLKTTREAPRSRGPCGPAWSSGNAGCRGWRGAAAGRGSRQDRAGRGRQPWPGCSSAAPPS